MMAVMTKNQEKEAELREMYDVYRGAYFGDKIPPVEEVTITVDDSMRGRTAGICTPGRKTITLSGPYLERFPEAELGLLLHEMIHFVEANHGQRFKQWMNFINQREGEAIVERHSWGKADQSRVKYEYHCQREGCGNVHETVRRLKDGGKRHLCKCRGSLVEYSV